MQKLKSFVSAIRIPVLIMLAAASIATFWFAAAPRSFADSTTCTICHKRATTLVVTCGSIDYQRHKDHGDTDGPCPASSP